MVLTKIMIHFPPFGGMISISLRLKTKSLNKIEWERNKISSSKLERSRMGMIRDRNSEDKTEARD